MEKANELFKKYSTDEILKDLDIKKFSDSTEHFSELSELDLARLYYMFYKHDEIDTIRSADKS